MKIFESFIESQNIPKVQFLMLFGKLSSPANKEQKELNEKTRDIFYEYFIIPEDKEKEVKLDSERPVINYRKERSEDIIKQNKINKCYNNWKTNFTFTSDKIKFHKNLNEFDFIPKTVFNLEEIDKLKFPIIAKPADGLSGVGIEKFDNIEEAKKSKLKFDLWSECIDFKREFRAIYLKENLFILYERIPSGNGEMVIGKKKPDEKLEFTYIEQDTDKIEFINELNNIVKKVRKKGMNTDIFSLDIFIDKNDKIWVIEINSGTGLGSNSLAKLYGAIYKDFYNKDITEKINSKIEEISDEYKSIIKKYFSKEYKKSYKPL